MAFFNKGEKQKLKGVLIILLHAIIAFILVSLFITLVSGFAK